MRHSKSAWGRAGAGAVALTAATLLCAPLAAQAADPQPNLVVTVEDLNTPSTRIGEGDRRPVKAEIRNEGDAPTGPFSVQVSVPDGLTLSGPADCTYIDWWPDDAGGPWAYGPGEATCAAPQGLAPGESLSVTGFTVRAGRNLPGPAEFNGHVAAVVGDEVLASGEFSFWTRRNTIDVAVSAPVVRGSAGDTADLTITVVNKGPSDGVGPRVYVAAPVGTVLLPSESCWTAGTDGEQRPESAAVECGGGGYFPTLYSGSGNWQHTIPLKIKSPLTLPGYVRVSGDYPRGTEAWPLNNTAPVVVVPR
ncbi:hypothetical protein JIG36_38510 [Actinoplanes sp. LDG1-06]|uniref:Uncharacterized protein n=1 Tax=Paractinoplanes ovalisporus TaxID=2810368 RepID=A0ABS2APW8_9ACTN|nr:hypothetical protein [Actinoplanes ovalisporus]MBM2621413.1 hypothetical protein [Actinoplanes ovalisporus]